MAIVSVKELHTRRRTSVQDGKLTHIRVFLVITDDIDDGTIAAITASDGTNSVPSSGTRLRPNNPFLVVNNKQAEPVNDSLFHFQVTVEYNVVDLSKQLGNPLLRPPEISWNPSDTSESYFLDCSKPKAKPVVNSAGDPFDNFMEREAGELTISITMNEATHDAALADTFSHTTNTNPVTIDGTTYDVGTLKLSPIAATKQTETVESDGISETFIYYRRTYILKARRKGWKDKPLDVGLNELIPDADPTKPKKLRPIVDSVNTPVKKPWPLDGTGRKKINPLNPTTPPEDPVALEFSPYEEKAWNTLAFTFPSTWATT